MRVTVELSTNDHVESVNDTTIFARPELEATSSASWNMSKNMDPFVISFGSEESVVEPLHHRLNFSARVHDPPVVDVAVVVVQRDHSESRTN